MTEKEKINKFMKDWETKYNPYAPMTEEYFYENEEEITQQLFLMVASSVKVELPDGNIKTLGNNVYSWLQSVNPETRNEFFSRVSNECEYIFIKEIEPNFIK